MLVVLQINLFASGYKDTNHCDCRLLSKKFKSQFPLLPILKIQSISMNLFFFLPFLHFVLEIKCLYVHYICNILFLLIVYLRFRC